MSADRGQDQRNELGAGREEVYSTNGGIVVTAYGLSDIGCQRPINQDTLGNRVSQFAAQAPGMGLLYAVADGMGGHARGEVASAVAIDELFARYYAVNPTLEPRQALAQVMIETNSAVHQAGRKAGGGTMGTTLTTVLLRDNILYVGNIGDSRTYLVRGDKIKQLSYDHSLIGEQVRSGLLTEAQARTSSIRNVITRAVGYRDIVEPDVFAFTVNPGDILLLCSDGLHGYVENEELARHLSTQPLKAAVDTLIALANERGGPDNITALVIRIDQIGDVVLSEDDERTTDVEIVVPDDQATKPMPAIRSQPTEEIVADLPPAPVAPPLPPARAAPAGAPPPPPPLAAPPIDHKAVTQVLQRVPPGPPTGPPPAPPLTIAPPPPARKGRIPVWFFLLLPLLLIGIIAAGAVAVGAMNGRQTAATATTGPAVGATPTAAGVAPVVSTTPTAVPTVVPTAPPAASAAPTSSGGVQPTSTRTGPALSPPLPTVGTQPSGATPTVAGVGLPVTITGTITFGLGVTAPANFATSWEVAFYDTEEWREKKQAAVVKHRAPITSALNNGFAFTTVIAMLPGSRTPFAIQVRQTDGKQIANSPVAEITIPGQLTFDLPIVVTGFSEPQAPAPSPTGQEQVVPGRTNDGLVAALSWALPRVLQAILQSLTALR